VAWEPTHTSTLFLLDAKGRPLLETRSVKYLDGFVPAHVEGLAYVPSMDRIVGSVFDASFIGHLVVMRRDGQVESEIFPQPPLDEEFISGVGFRPGNGTRPDELLVGTAGFALSTLFTMGFDGNTRDAVDLSPEQDFEGVAQLPSGDVVAVPYNPGSLRFLDPDLNPTPARDLSYTIGIGKNLPFTLAWDPDLDRLLVDRQGIPVVTEVAAVTVPSLRSASTVVDLDPFVDVGQFVAVTYRLRPGRFPGARFDEHHHRRRGNHQRSASRRDRRERAGQQRDRHLPAEASGRRPRLSGAPSISAAPPRERRGARAAAARAGASHPRARRP
jgi:hypothetical protein